MYSGYESFMCIANIFPTFYLVFFTSLKYLDEKVILNLNRVELIYFEEESIGGDKPTLLLQ